MKNKDWFKDKHISFHDAVIDSISILKEGHVLSIHFSSIDVYESDSFIDAFTARLRLTGFKRILLDGLWDGECSVDDGLIFDEKNRSISLVDLVRQKQPIEKLIIDIVNWATLLVDKAEAEFEVFEIE